MRTTGTCIQSHKPTLTNAGTWNKSTAFNESLALHGQNGNNRASYKELQWLLNEMAMVWSVYKRAQHLNLLFFSLLYIAVRRICFRRMGNFFWKSEEGKGLLIHKRSQRGPASFVWVWVDTILGKKGYIKNDFSNKEIQQSLDCAIFTACNTYFIRWSHKAVRQRTGKHADDLGAISVYTIFSLPITFLISTVLNPCISDATVNEKNKRKIWLLTHF